MSEERIPTTERLAKAMEKEGCPDWMVTKAREGYYDDYKSSIATPCIQLVDDLALVARPLLRARALRGEFDAQKWESDEWANLPETRKMMLEGGFTKEMMSKLFGVNDA